MSARFVIKDFMVTVYHANVLFGSLLKPPCQAGFFSFLFFEGQDQDSDPVILGKILQLQIPCCKEEKLGPTENNTIPASKMNA